MALLFKKWVKVFVVDDVLACRYLENSKGVRSTSIGGCWFPFPIIYENGWLTENEIRDISKTKLNYVL